MDRFLGMVVLHIGIRESKNVGKISVKVRKMAALKVCKYAMSKLLLAVAILYCLPNLFSQLWQKYCKENNLMKEWLSSQ